jgi:hypothetical protein
VTKRFRSQCETFRRFREILAELVRVPNVPVAARGSYNSYN